MEAFLRILLKRRRRGLGCLCFLGGNNQCPIRLVIRKNQRSGTRKRSGGKKNPVKEEGIGLIGRKKLDQGYKQSRVRRRIIADQGGNAAFKSNRTVSGGSRGKGNRGEELQLFSPTDGGTKRTSFSVRGWAPNKIQTAS